MAIAADHARPMMSAAASLHAHQARRQLREKFLDRGSPKLALHHHSSELINPMNLKNVLRQIQTNRANLRHGRLPLSGSTHIASLAHRCRSGAVHPIIASAAKQSSLPEWRCWIAHMGIWCVKMVGQLFV